jgi:hypothetical protein
MRHAPEIAFVRDDSIDKAIKMTQLLDEIAAARKPSKPAKKKPAKKAEPKKPAPKKPAPKKRTDGEGEEE